VGGAALFAVGVAASLLTTTSSSHAGAAGSAIGAATSSSVESVTATSPTSAAADSATLTSAQRSLKVAVLGYHQFDGPAKDPWVLPPAAFRQQMQALKDANITVIPMADFLAWRRGEKAIPEKSVVITIDDGYVSGYRDAWPILKEFGYPFTMYVYTNFIGHGGKSISWDQLREMSAAGVDIGCHSRSHDVMTNPRHRANTESSDAWLHAELVTACQEISTKIGLPIKTFAFPYGKHNDAISAAGLASGFDAMFTITDEPALIDSPPGKIGRYLVRSDLPDTFDKVLRLFDPTRPKTSVTTPATSSEPDSAPVLTNSGPPATQ
jgi:peptidoglycan/xylan/chitin deacetylase (PgdA/CDA1 family)